MNSLRTLLSAFTVALSTVVLLFEFENVAAQTRTGSNTSSQQTTVETPLEPSKPIDRELAGGQWHSYQITLTAGQFLHVVVDQRGIDVVVALFSPGDEEVVEMNNRNSDYGQEALSFEATLNGTYRLRLSAASATAASGRYVMRMNDLHSTTASDKTRIEAERALGDGQRLVKQATADSYRQALERYEIAFKMWSEINDRYWAAITLTNLGVVYGNLGENQKALSYFNQALPLTREVKDIAGEASTLVSIGVVSMFVGESQKALDHYNQALPLWRAVGERRGEAGTISNIGSVYDALGEKQKALDYYNRALPVQRAFGDRRGEAIILTNIGLVYDSLGENQKALDCYNEALILERSVGDRSGEARTLNNIGNVYDALGDNEKALDYYNQSLPLKRAVGDRGGEANTLSNIGNVYYSLGEMQKALEYYRQALPLKRAVGDRAGEARQLNNIGYVYEALGEKQEALAYHNQSLPLRRAVGDRGGEAKTLYGMARIEREKGNIVKARTLIETALNIVEQLRTKVTSQELRASYLSTVQAYYQYYIDLLMQMQEQQPSQKFNAAALQASERGRARSLLELLNEAHADIRQGADPKLLEREWSLQQLLNNKTESQIRLLAGKHTDDQAAEAAKEIEALKIEYQRIEVDIRTKSPRYAALTQPQPLNSSQIQQLLDKDTMLLEYALGDEHSYLWAVSQSSIASYELPKRVEIETAAKQFYEGLTAPNQQSRSGKQSRQLRRVNVGAQDHRVVEAAASLSRMLLAPVTSRLEKKRLVIVADGALQYVPFAALPAPIREIRVKGPASDRRRSLRAISPPLVIDHEVINLPSASTLAVLRRETEGRKSADKVVAVLADPVFDKNDERVTSARTEKRSNDETAKPALSRQLEYERTKKAAAQTGVAGTGLSIPRLPGTRQEAERILAFAPANARMKALDFEASRATATNAELGHYRYVHFATHGFLNSANPELSGIVLSMVDQQGQPQNGFLLANEIFNLRLPAELVVLSACQTALGKEVEGEGLVGLTRGFMYAGAPRVIVSLWSVDDKATSEMMSRLYQGLLRRHLRPAAALRTAQIEMRKQKRWEAPYYWAAFTIQGEWR